MEEGRQNWTGKLCVYGGHGGFKGPPDLQTLSPVPTMFFQPAIPQLPVPSLHDTCQRYLTAQLVFLSPKEYAKTQSLVDEFQKGAGVDLNKELVELNKKNSHLSYSTGNKSNQSDCVPAEILEDTEG
ncbi:carnitine O-palmitoyltransferase 2, mitochondrial-like isoform X2 [Acanthaster planci]|uniref:Carnitine O-palmitoyltransferase 2, mitochondrial-like isoform X2 n=1 Tax=Acanthaster planci TaxID=133434 RepID=A0A8B7ZS06_ACAPL|nr:carnitine O-palmitoyltransferase 2, mitochondrial-like isoform X2 [Acanthaster planci]